MERPAERRGGALVGFVIVFFGAGLGGAARHAVNLAAARLLGTAFPFGTLAVNILGSMLMGLIAGWFAFKGDASQHWRLFLTTGILGGFTTFSAFSLDIALLWERHDLLALLTYVSTTFIVSVASLMAGLLLMRQVL
ncbi:MAG: fluoride efflux transporter CrcB [Phreatobacter sp.]